MYPSLENSTTRITTTMGYLIWSPRLPLLPNEFDPQVDRTARPVTDPGNRCQWCLVSQVIWCCLALMSGKMCGRHLGGIFLCAHERIPRGLGRFSFSKAWRAVSGGEARKLLRSALPTNIRFNGRRFKAQQVVKSTERNI